MRTAHDPFAPLYSVISIDAEPCRAERSVLAYSDEKTLRKLLAEPKIVVVGYRSREEAMASHNECALIPPTSQSNLTPETMEVAARCPDQSCTTEQRFDYGVDVAKHRDLVYSLFIGSFVAATAFFYSKSLLSAVIRAVILP